MRFERALLTVLRIFVCVLMCFVRWSDRMNFFVHSGHWKRFSPVWVLRCLWSSSDLVNFLPQNIHVQMKGRSPVCQRKWARKWLVFPYTLLHPAMWHTCCRFLVISLFLLRNINVLIFINVTKIKYSFDIIEIDYHSPVSVAAIGTRTRDSSTMLLIRIVSVVIGDSGGRVRYLLLMGHGCGRRRQGSVRLKSLKDLPLGRIVRVELHGWSGRDDGCSRGSR